jgi:hypothetical protein
MIRADEIAVCVSGLAREGYKEAIERAKKVFPYREGTQLRSRGQKKNCGSYKTTNIKFP